MVVAALRQRRITRPICETARQNRAVFSWSKIEWTTSQVWREIKRGDFDGCNMAKSETVGLSYGALRKQCLEAVRQWPGCETIGAIQIVRNNTPGAFSVRVTLYGTADRKTADRAIICVQREQRRLFHLND
jgi:hypothetical protein